MVVVIPALKPLLAHLGWVCLNGQGVARLTSLHWGVLDRSLLVELRYLKNVLHLVRVLKAEFFFNG